MKTPKEYKSLKGYSKEVLNRLVSETAGAAAYGIPAAIAGVAIAGPEGAAVLGTLGGIVGGIDSDYNSLKRTNINKVTPGKYLGRYAANAVLPIPFVTDYVTSRHLQSYGDSTENPEMQSAASPIYVIDSRTLKHLQSYKGKK